MKFLAHVFAATLASIAFSVSAQVQSQVGDQVVANSDFYAAVPTYYATGQVAYYKPQDWACPTYKNSPYGSWCTYQIGAVGISAYRTSARLQPSGYWYQRVYLSAGTYDVEGAFNASGARDGATGVVLTINTGGPTATGPQLLVYRSNEGQLVKTGTLRIDTAGYYYLTLGNTGAPQLQTSGRVSTILVDRVLLTMTGL